MRCGLFHFFEQKKTQEVCKLKKKMIPKSPQQSEPKTRLHPHIPIARIAYTAFLCVMLSMMFCQPAFAATDVWSKAKEVMQDVYNQILLISTVAAIVTASVALLMMNFSRSGRTVDESRAWLKRICITWAILNSLGFIMAYIAPFFSDGKWAG
ncbi:fimbrial protein [Lacrimispora amygdalina]|uniref:Fimbrial protein n=2 Tax=Lacrimispora amygdalina TaxID=253257 RepID=A0A3E2N9F5_9FIRM|nr:fimbrial protein [Clostridium indicum]